MLKVPRQKIFISIQFSVHHQSLCIILLRQGVSQSLKNFGGCTSNSIARSCYDQELILEKWGAHVRKAHHQMHHCLFFSENYAGPQFPFTSSYVTFHPKIQVSKNVPIFCQ